MSRAVARGSTVLAARDAVARCEQPCGADRDAARRFMAVVDIHEGDPHRERHEEDASQAVPLASGEQTDTDWAGLVELASLSNWRLTMDLQAHTGCPSSVQVDHDGQEILMLLSTSSPSLYQAWSASLDDLHGELQRRCTLPFSLRLEYAADDSFHIRGDSNEPAKGELP